MLVALSVGNMHYGPRCYHDCTIVTEFSADSNDYMKDLEDKDKKCGDDTIKYCGKDETCNSFSFSAKSKVTMKGQNTAVDGSMKMTYHYCGASTDKDQDVPKTDCDPIGPKMQADFDKLDEDVAGFTVKDIVVTCGEKIKSCDGKSEECVKMSEHPDWKDPHDVSAGTVPKICTLLLAYPFLAPMM
jgi:hypothetical protein